MRFYRRPGTKFLWCEHHLNGREVRFSTRTEDPSEAEKFAIAEIAKRQRQQPVVQQPDGLLALAAADMARATAENASPRHVLALEKLWQDITDHFGEVELNSINEDSLDALVIALRARYKGQSIRRHVAALMRGLAIAYRRRWRTEPLPIKPKIKSDPADERRQSKSHPQDIVLQVFERLPVEVADACRVVSVTGVRYATLRRIEASMVHFYENGTSLLRLPAHVLKQRTGLDIDCPKATTALLKRYVDTGRTVLFPRVNYSKALAKASRDVGYEHTITLRDLRAICASEVVEETQSLSVAARRLGHATVKTTARYVKFRPGKEQDVANSQLEERLGLAGNMIGAQSSVDLRTAEKMSFTLSGLDERETGFEPATFSLEGSAIREFPMEFPAFFLPKPPKIAMELPPGDEHVRAQSSAAQTAIVKPQVEVKTSVDEYPRVHVQCERCARTSEQDIKGRMACLYCDGPVRIVL
jgi:integrase